MGIDLGNVRTGVSLCDQDEILAYPFCVINEPDKDLLAAEIVKLYLEHNVEKIILGYPKNMDGSIGKSAKSSEKFRKLILKLINIDIILWDERLSTLDAQKKFIDVNKKVKNYRKEIDSASASLILQNFLNFNHSII